MRWIIGSSLRFRLLVVPVAAAVLFLGFAQLRSAPVDVLPEFTPVAVEVQTEALGLSAAEVEQLITVPLEQDLLNGVAWLAQIRSESVVGLSSIELVFQPGTDILRARQMVQERLAQAHALPHVSKPPMMLQPLSSTNRVMMIGMSSADVSLIDMSVLARWKIRPRLMGIPGVANVAIFGQRERQLQVQVDPAKLAARGVQLNEVVTTTANAVYSSPLTYVEASTPGTGGFIDTAVQRLPIRHVLSIRTPDDLAQVAVDGTRAKPLRVGEVATVVEDHQPLIGDAVLNAGPGLMLVVEKSPGSNTLEVSRQVEEALAAMRPGLRGIDMDSNVFKPASFIQTALDNILLTVAIGALLLLVLIGLFFFEWRTALISFVSIPVSLAAAVLVLSLRGVTYNMMILAGLVMALGVIVDNAIVDIERIRQRIREHRAGENGTVTAGLIRHASAEVRGSIVFGTLVTLVSVSPLFFVPGLTGYFATPIAISYALAVVASTVVALTLTPALAMLLLASGPAAQPESPLLRWITKIYDDVSRVVARPRQLFIGAGFVLVVGLALLPLLSFGASVPTLQDRNLLISYEATPGTSRPEMIRVVTQASEDLRAVKGVDNVGAHVGRAVTGDQIVGINSGEIWVSLAGDADYHATVAGIQSVVDNYPGFERDIRTYPAAKMREAQTGSTAPIVVRVFGQDLNVLRSKAAEVRAMLAGINGVSDPQIEAQPEEDTIEIEVNLVNAQKYGLKPGDVRRTAAILLSGLEVGNLFEEQKVFEVVVYGAPSVRKDLDSIRQLLIDTPSGRQVRLKDVADVRVAKNPTVIRRDAVSHRLDVTAEVSGRSVDAVVADIETKLPGVRFPVEYHAEVLGDYSQGRADRNTTWAMTAVAVIGVFLLLQAGFGSWKLATAFFLALPLALVGGVLTALLGGGVLSLGALVGFLAVYGLAVRNGILLIKHYQQLQRQGEPFGLDLVMRGTRERLAPIVMTALLTAATMLPFVLLGSVAGLEVVRPMAIVILGGLVTSTLLSLVLLPALYLQFGNGAGQHDLDTAAAGD